MSGRNPILLPELPPVRRGCPKCGCPDFDGRRIDDTVVFTCSNKECGNSWEGGLPMRPTDPMAPSLPDSYRQPVERLAIRSKQGDMVGVEEIHHRQSTTPSFKTKNQF